MKTFFANMFKGLTVTRIVLMCIGVFFIGMSVSLSRLSSLGTDPFSCMNLGVSSVLRDVTGSDFFTYANYQLLVNLVLLIPMFIFMLKGIGIGTIINMVFVGYSADLCMYVYKMFNLTPEVLKDNMVIKVICMILALLVLTFGVALYMQCNRGIAPYDALAPIMEDKTNGKLKYAIGRIITDCLCVLIGFLAGSVVGINTLVMMFGTGPFVSFFRNNVAKKIIPDEQ